MRIRKATWTRSAILSAPAASCSIAPTPAARRCIRRRAAAHSSAIGRRTFEAIDWASRHGARPLIALGRRTALWKMMRRKFVEDFPPLSEESAEEIRAMMLPETEELERITGGDLSNWKPRAQHKSQRWPPGGPTRRLDNRKMELACLSPIAAAGNPRRRRASAACASAWPERRDDVALHADRRRQSVARQSIWDGRGGCNLAGWKFHNQDNAVWSAVPDPFGGVESGNCVAQITNAPSSTLGQVADHSLSLSPGFYSIRCNIATTNNNSAQMSIQYVHAGNGACLPASSWHSESTRMTLLAIPRRACKQS